VDGVSAYAIPVFNQYVVVPADGDEEQHHLHVVEDVDPLLPFRALSTHVEHAVGEVARIEDRLGDACRP